MPTNQFDVIVVGVGSMGAAACAELSERGLRVLGLEQFDIPHTLGSHAGQSRIIRMAYFEHPNYVPLLQRAYTLWADLEQKTNTKLYYKTGLVYFGTPHNAIIEGVQEAAALYNIPLKVFDHTTLKADDLFPQFNIPNDYTVLFESEAGFISPEKAVSTLVNWAVHNGATIKTNEGVINWAQKGGNIVVETAHNIYTADKIIFTTGAWSNQLPPQLKTVLQPTLQTVLWTQPRDISNFSMGKLPCWLFAVEGEGGAYYGFPMLNPDEFGTPNGLKIAYHYPAAPFDPQSLERNAPQADIDKIRAFAERFMPDAAANILNVKTCLYTYSPDEHFIIDFLPETAGKALVACGFSGHGFKFVPVIGEVLADLTINGATQRPIDFLGLKRFL